MFNRSKVADNRRQTEKELLRELEEIPESEPYQRMFRYEELLEIYPENLVYRQKKDYYQNVIDKEKAELAERLAKTEREEQTIAKARVAKQEDAKSQEEANLLSQLEQTSDTDILRISKIYDDLFYLNHNKYRKKMEHYRELVAEFKVAKLQDLKEPLELIEAKVELKEDEYSRKFAYLVLRLKNMGAKRVSAYEIKVKVSTKLGTKIGTFTLTSDNSSIDPLEESRDSYGWKDNRFIAAEPYDRLAGVSNNNLVVKILSQRVVKEDISSGH